MKNTIKAEKGYRVSYYFEKCTIASHTNKYGKVYDGDKLIMTAEIISYEDYIDEKENNECFKQLEVFTTVNGNQFVYWTYTEFNLNYLTKIIKEQK